MRAGTSDENCMLLVMPLGRGGSVVGATGGATGAIELTWTLTDTASDEDGGDGGRAGTADSVAKVLEDGERSAEADLATLGNFPNNKRDLRLDGCSIHFPTHSWPHITSPIFSKVIFNLDGGLFIAAKFFVWRAKKANYCTVLSKKERPIHLFVNFIQVSSELLLRQIRLSICR
jgi:hypothetical protein